MVESYLCIDIGTSSIKVLEKDGNEKVLRWGILERPAKPFHSSIQPIDAQDVAGSLRDLLLKMGVLARSAVMSLPSFCVFTAITNIVDPKIIPANPATYRLEAHQLADGRYFVVAIPKEVSEKYEEIARLCGLDFSGLELESSAIARRFENTSARRLIVDIGSRLTTFSVIRGGAVEYIFYTDFGGASHALDVIMNKTQEIAKEHDISRIIFSNSVFNIANGLQKISSPAFNDYGR